MSSPASFIAWAVAEERPEATWVITREDAAAVLAFFDREKHAHLDAEVTRLWEALFWISEFPNRAPDDWNPRESAIALAEWARAAISVTQMNPRAALAGVKPLTGDGEPVAPKT